MLVICCTSHGQINAYDLMDKTAELFRLSIEETDAMKLNEGKTVKKDEIFTLSIHNPFMGYTHLPEPKDKDGNMLWKGTSKEVEKQGAIRLASGGRDTEIRIWRISADGTQGVLEFTHFAPQDAHNGDVREAVLSDDGLLVLSSSGDRKTKLWDIDSGSCVATFDCGAHVNTCRFVSRFGTRNKHDDTWAGSGLILTCSKYGAVLWDIETQEKIIDPFCDTHDGKVIANCCTVLDDDSRIAICQKDGSTTLVDLRTAPAVMRLDEPDKHGRGASAGVCKEIDTFKMTDSDGKECIMAVSCSYRGTLSIWNILTGELMKQYQVLEGKYAQLMDCQVFPKATEGEARLVTCGGQKEVLFYGGESWETLEHEWTYTGHKSITRGVAVCKSGTRVISCSKDKEVHVIDLELGPRGNVVSGDCVRTLKGHKDLVDRCRLFDHDTKILSASWDNYAKVWDIESGKCIKTLEGNGKKLRGCATFKDGTRERAVAVGSGDTLCVWDIDDLEEGNEIRPTTVQIPTEHRSTIWGLVLEERPNRDGASEI